MLNTNHTLHCHLGLNHPHSGCAEAQDTLPTMHWVTYGAAVSVLLYSSIVFVVKSKLVNC